MINNDYFILINVLCKNIMSSEKVNIMFLDPKATWHEEFTC